MMARVMLYLITAALADAGDTLMFLQHQAIAIMSTPDLELTATMPGMSAPLSEVGYQQVARTESDIEMAIYVKRLLESGRRVVVDEGELMVLVPWFSGTKAVQNLAQLTTALGKQRWLQHPCASGMRRCAEQTQGLLEAGASANSEKHMSLTNLVGLSVMLTEEGYEEVAQLQSDLEMAIFVKRLLTSRGQCITNEGELMGFVQWYSGTKAIQSYEQLENEVDSMPWVTTRDPKEKKTAAVDATATANTKAQTVDATMRQFPLALPQELLQAEKRLQEAETRLRGEAKQQEVLKAQGQTQPHGEQQPAQVQHSSSIQNQRPQASETSDTKPYGETKPKGAEKPLSWIEKEANLDVEQTPRRRVEPDEEEELQSEHEQQQMQAKSKPPVEAEPHKDEKPRGKEGHAKEQHELQADDKKLQANELQELHEELQADELQGLQDEVQAEARPRGQVKPQDQAKPTVEAKPTQIQSKRISQTAIVHAQAAEMHRQQMKLAAQAARKEEPQIQAKAHGEAKPQRQAKPAVEVKLSGSSAPIATPEAKSTAHQIAANKTAMQNSFNLVTEAPMDCHRKGKQQYNAGKTELKYLKDVDTHQDCHIRCIAETECLFFTWWKTKDCRLSRKTATLINVDWEAFTGTRTCTSAKANRRSRRLANKKQSQQSHDEKKDSKNGTAHKHQHVHHDKADENGSSLPDVRQKLSQVVDTLSNSASKAESVASGFVHSLETTFRGPDEHLEVPENMFMVHAGSEAEADKLHAMVARLQKLESAPTVVHHKTKTSATHEKKHPSLKKTPAEMRVSFFGPVVDADLEQHKRGFLHHRHMLSTLQGKAKLKQEALAVESALAEEKAQENRIGQEALAVEAEVLAVEAALAQDGDDATRQEAFAVEAALAEESSAEARSRLGLLQLNAVTLPRVPVRPQGASAALTEDGYQQVAESCSDEDLSVFGKRVLARQGKVISNEGDLSGFVPWFSGSKACRL